MIQPNKLLNNDQKNRPHDLSKFCTFRYFLLIILWTLAKTYIAIIIEKSSLEQQSRQSVFCHAADCINDVNRP